MVVLQHVNDEMGQEGYRGGGGGASYCFSMGCSSRAECLASYVIVDSSYLSPAGVRACNLLVVKQQASSSVVTSGASN